MDIIKKLLREDLEYFSVDNASAEQDEFKIGLEEEEEYDIMSEIKKSLEAYNEKYKASKLNF